MTGTGDMQPLAPDMDGNAAAPFHGLQILVQIAKEDGGQLVIRKIKISTQRLQGRSALLIFWSVCQGLHLFFVEWLQWCAHARDGH